MTTPITDRVRDTLATLPDHVRLVAAAKTRSPDEIRAALAGGVRIIGMNYVKEAAAAIDQLGRETAEWHMIGHLQRNKVREAIRLCDLIQTVDSMRLAERIDTEARNCGLVMPVLVEVNSAQEPQKAGVAPDDVIPILREMAGLRAIRVEGLMTMGPLTPDAEAIRPYFRLTKALFDEAVNLAIEGVRMATLSMGMSDSYAVAIEEGSTMVRMGTILFGPRTR